MVLHQTFKWGKTNPPMPKQQLVWNSKVRNIKKKWKQIGLFSQRKKERKFPYLFSFLAASLFVSLCLSPAVIDLTQLQLKQKKNEVDVQKAAQQTSVLMSPPLQLERQQGLAASPGSADIRQPL